MTEFERIAAGLMRNIMAEPAWKVDKLGAAAVVGNFARETGDFKFCNEQSPTVPGSRGGINLAQWTGPRRRLFEAYAMRNHLPLCAWSTGYKFFFHETQTDAYEGRWVKAVNAAPTLDLKVEAFEKAYERAGVVAMADRKARALRALQAYEKYPNAEPIVPLPGVPVPVPPQPLPPDVPKPCDCCDECPEKAAKSAVVLPPPATKGIEEEPFWTFGSAIGVVVAVVVTLGGFAVWFFN